MEPQEEVTYELTLTNYEVKRMFNRMVRGWFGRAEADYNDFIQALLVGDKKAMNSYMNRVALYTFSYFDTGRKPSLEEPERFYHGFVLGLMVDLQGRYVITSNRESGFGRYDVMLEPKNPQEDDGILMEFKVHDPDDGDSLENTVQAEVYQAIIRGFTGVDIHVSLVALIYPALAAEIGIALRTAYFCQLIIGKGIGFGYISRENKVF